MKMEISSSRALSDNLWSATTRVDAGEMQKSLTCLGVGSDRLKMIDL